MENVNGDADSIAAAPDDSQGPNRLLKPVRNRDDWPRAMPDAETFRRVCVLDTETTGLDADRHRVIEICAAAVQVSNDGRIIGIESIGSGTEDPGAPLAEEIIALTGLTDDDIAGTSINREKLTQFISNCDSVVAFNAGFDRPFVEKLLRGLPLMNWGCAMADVPWRSLNFQPGPQNYLLMQAGRFNANAHRARDDVLSLVELLDHVCTDGESVMAKVLSAIDSSAWRFEATAAPYHFRDDLKDRRYRWAPGMRHKIWHKHVRQADFRSEYRWYKKTVGTRPSVVPLPATERFRATHTWAPKRLNARTPSWLR
ncbi:3'-5' exonuclease [Citromicrobium bathyomarinum]|uniref:3'-5' exonuclease n=1 Tax=Citromicrobium bathyomarinum TaxID=72174 RepID=UPI00315A3579